MDMNSRLEDAQQAEPATPALYKNASKMARRSRPILLLLSGLYLLWLFRPVYYRYGSLLWLENIAAILIFCGLLGWAMALYLSSSHNRARQRPVLGLIVMFAVNALLDVLARICIHLYDPFELPELGIRFEVISATNLAYGAAGMFAYALIFKYMHRLNLKNLPRFLFAWHALTSLAAGVSIELAYGFRSFPLFHLVTPFTSGLFYALLHLIVLSAGLLTAWWLAKDSISAGDPRTPTG